MQTESASAVFKVLSSDNLIYGPIDLATLVQWIQERRVQRETWIFLETANDWVAAGSIDALKREFDDLGAVPEVALNVDADIFPEVTLDELRRFERFAPYSDEDLALLLTFCEFVMADKDDVIIKKGDLSDSMFLVLSGQVRARLRVGGHDTTLGTMEPGELFGEIAMLSQTARSADVVADVPARLLRLTSENFQELMTKHSELAARMLFNMSRQLATRLCQRNQELYKDLASSFVWR
jgi:CRP-like cAMP-binding protein